MIGLVFIVAGVAALVAALRRGRRVATRATAPETAPPVKAPAAPTATAPRPAELCEIAEIAFVDVETTGLDAADRIVAFGGVRLRIAPPGEIRTLHLVFNPQRKCQPRAAAIHGWDDATLAAQDPIGPYAAALRAWIGAADLVVAHNAEFDLRFLSAAFSENGVAPLSLPGECTMLAYRARGEGSAALDAVTTRLGLPARRGHSAVEDAWRCMQVWLWLRGLPWRLDFAALGDPGPANLLPIEKQKRGRPRKAATLRKAAATASAADPPKPRRAGRRSPAPSSNRYQNPIYRAFAAARWALATPTTPGFSLAVRVDGEPCVVHSFSRRPKESFYVNLTADGRPGKLSLVHSHHEWELPGGGNLADWATRFGALAAP